MKKNSLLETMDIIIISVIVIQFVMFMLNYETKLVITIFSALQFVSLIIYFIYSVKLRAGFETIVNQESEFFNKQFKEIKYNFDRLSYDVTEYFDRQRDITDIQNIFSNSRMAYRKRFSLDNNQTLGFDLILITNKGIFIFDFFEAVFVLKGNYQNDIIKIQYSKNNEIEVFNPLSKLHPVYQTLKQTLNIEDNDMIKRMLILDDDSLVTGLETLDQNQGITKNIDITSKLRQLIDQSMVKLTVTEIEKYKEILDKKIAG
ncbi:MAG: hypothetical protein PF513_05420 [Tenericutes bacterium]|jgi:hypothetical protein|nr:hypothetical protein [Mycoplasmatota bacterium]